MMLFYKIFRYICFLFFIVFAVLFFMPRTQFNVFSPVYEAIENFYTSIPQFFDSSPEIHDDIIVEDTKKYLLYDAQERLDGFMNDISVEFALDDAVERNFDDLTYLIDTYLIACPFFKDMIAYYDGNVVYKKNQLQSDNPIIFKYQKEIRRGIINLAVVFEHDIINEYISNRNEILVVYYQSQFFANNDAFVGKAREYITRESGTHSIGNSYVLHKGTLSDNLASPIEIFYFEKREFNLGFVIQMLFWVSIILLWVLLVLLDGRIIKGIQDRSFSKEYDEYLTQNVLNENGEKDIFGWLEELVQEEATNDDKSPPVPQQKESENTVDNINENKNEEIENDNN